MLSRLLLACTLWLTTAPIFGAPTTGTKSKKEPAAEEKKKDAPTDSYKVKRGETLWGIARLHGVSVGDIMDLNHLSDSTLRDGQILKIPRPGSDPALSPAKATSHIIAKGETFRNIARKYGLTQEDLEGANPKIDSATPKAGTKLIIPATVSTTEKSVAETAKPKPSGTTHTVTETDTFYTIAKKYGSTEAAIAAENPSVNPNRLRPGSKINLPARAPLTRKEDAVDSSTQKHIPPISPATKKTVTSPVPDDTADKEKPVEEEKPKTRRYVVSADETPQTISEAFDIPVKQLYEMNGLKPGSPMKSGLEIQVPNNFGKAP
ncbi:MAG: LysM peptidoglycan-binding domain-containing protein [Verrucomicrobia bacterium]|nr:LysM peptidoglycan-binding domain-containing protein [Verrucomicrobiota bacterium]